MIDRSREWNFLADGLLLHFLLGLGALNARGEDEEDVFLEGWGFSIFTHSVGREVVRKGFSNYIMVASFHLKGRYLGILFARRNVIWIFYFG